MDPNNSKQDEEAQALAACYRLLLQKAAKRRVQLTKTDKNYEDDLETAVPSSNVTWVEE